MSATVTTAQGIGNEQAAGNRQQAVSRTDEWGLIPKPDQSNWGGTTERLERLRPFQG